MNATTLDPNRSPSEKTGAVEWCVLAVAVVLLIAMRLHAFGLPLEADECNYAYIGERLVAGDQLYVDVWDHQPPGIFMLFATVISILGNAPEVFRWLTTLFSAGSLVLIYFLLRGSAGRAVAIAGAATFVLVSSDPGTAGEGCNREIFMNTLLLGAWLCTLQAARSNKHSARRRSIFLAGLLLAVASFIKTIVAVHWLLLGMCLLFDQRSRAERPNRWRPLLATSVWFAAGPVIVWTLTFAYFAATGRFRAFAEAVFRFNLSYADANAPFAARFTQFFHPSGHPFTFDSAWSLWIGAAVATGWLVIDSFRRKRNPFGPAILAYIMASYIAACLPARFWPHYYYLLIPPAVIIVSLAIGHAVKLSSSALRTQRPLWSKGVLILYFIIPLLLFQSEYDEYLAQPLFGITVKRYNSRDFWGRAQGENVRSVTAPDDTIFVYGNDPEIYYYANRRCASRYTMITALQAKGKEVERHRANLLHDLEKNKPKLIILLFDMEPFDDWKRFLDAYYQPQPIGVDRHDRTGEPIMLVLARKGETIPPVDWNWDRSAVGGWLPGAHPR